MRALQKLVRNGNATRITIPRSMLHHVGWLPGESMIIELLEDNSFRLRRPSLDDFPALGVSRMLHAPLPLVSR